MVYTSVRFRRHPPFLSYLLFLEFCFLLQFTFPLPAVRPGGVFLSYEDIDGKRYKDIGQIDGCSCFHYRQADDRGKRAGHIPATHTVQKKKTGNMIHSFF